MTPVKQRAVVLFCLRSTHVSSYGSDGYDLSAPSLEYFEHVCSGEYVNDNASESYTRRQSSQTPASCSTLSENESADSVLFGSGVSSGAQQGRFSAYNHSDPNNLLILLYQIPPTLGTKSDSSPAAQPRSQQQQAHKTIQRLTTLCIICKMNFASNSGLKRHVENRTLLWPGLLGLHCHTLSQIRYFQSLGRITSGGTAQSNTHGESQTVWSPESGHVCVSFSRAAIV